MVVEFRFSFRNTLNYVLNYVVQLVNWDEDLVHLQEREEGANCINLSIIEQLCDKEQLNLYVFLSGC